MNVLVIPEDFRKDQYVLRPLVQAMLARLGRPQAKVRVLMDPLLGGIDAATDLATLRDEILVRYKGMVHLFLLLVDRDALPGRRVRLEALEGALRPELPERKCFLAECAHQELEVWALAGADLPADWTWAEIRAERDPKERYFAPLVADLGLTHEPGEGRDTLGTRAAARLARVLQLCPELEHLASRMATFIETSRSEGAPFDG